MNRSPIPPVSRAASGALGLMIAALISGCGGPDMPPLANRPAPILLGTPADPVPIVVEQGPTLDPELSLEERWRAPFAVVSSGRPPARPTRPPVVVIGEDPPVTETPVVAATEPPAAAATQPATRTARPPEARTPPAAPRAAAASSERTHRIEWGETWFGIARRYSVTTAALALANPEIDPNRIRSGQVLRIPRGGAAPAAANSQQRTHTVGAGETLWGIARRYGLTPEEIRTANKMQDDRVRLGQTLIIPGSENSR